MSFRKSLSFGGRLTRGMRKGTAAASSWACATTTPTRASSNMSRVTSERMVFSPNGNRRGSLLRQGGTVTSVPGMSAHKAAPSGARCGLSVAISRWCSAFGLLLALFSRGQVTVLPLQLGGPNSGEAQIFGRDNCGLCVLRNSAMSQTKCGCRSSVSSPPRRTSQAPRFQWSK